MFIFFLVTTNITIWNKTFIQKMDTLISEFRLHNVNSVNTCMSNAISGTPIIHSAYLNVITVSDITVMNECLNYV